ncbi:hypothetical protein [Luteimonas abyssi]|uniref:hypothetical protein n=1 Tax=Luteimonas abyssi TaxID=1247514 RepID=UPI0009E7D1F3|nr:hypothetical protein [Luteimonas abyssi]
MAADFFFQDPTFEIQPLTTVAIFKWQRLGNPEVQYAIAAEEQYLQFHLYMLKNLRHTRAGQLADPPYRRELGLSVRAGAVKAAVLVAASITEAALRAIAETRGYTLNQDLRRRTFGNVIRAWEIAGAPQPEVADVWPQVKAMHAVRNFVHLHAAAEADDAAWVRVLEREDELLQGALRVIDHVAAIEA